MPASSTPKGMGCACGGDRNKPFGRASFGMGNLKDSGVRLYGDWYGPRVPGAMIINGDRPGLGAYYGSGARRPGMGDVGTFITSLTSGDFTGALTGNNFFSGVPNWFALIGGAWVISSIVGDTKRVSKRVKRLAA